MRLTRSAHPDQRPGTPRGRRSAAWAAEVLRVNTVEDTRWVALRAGFTVVVMLGLLAATGHGAWALYAVFGGFANIHGPGRAAPGRWRVQAVVGVMQVLAVAVGALVGLSPQRDWLAVLAVPCVALAAHAGYDRWRIVPHAPLFTVLATAAVGAKAMTPADVAPAVLVTAGAATFAVLLGIAAGRVHRPRAVGVAPVGITPVGRVARRDGLLAAGTIAACGIAANLVHLAHPFWAMFSASVVLSMPAGRARAVRAVNRIVGTTLGVLLAFPLLGLPLPAWQLVLLAGVLQGLAVMLVPRQYALAMLAITPLALMVNEWAAPQPVVPLLQARLVDTALGSVIALAVVVLDRRFARR